MTLKIGRVRFPVFAIINAVPAAVRAAHQESRDNRDDDSPGGSKVTPLEVAETIAAFVTTLGERIAKPIADANGVSLDDITAGA